MIAPVQFGSKTYSIEELTAEIGSCYILSFAGIGLKSHFTNSVAYRRVAKKLQSDKRFIMYGASAALRAIDFILNVQPEK